MDPLKMVVFIVLIVSLAGVMKAFLARGRSDRDFASMMGLDDTLGDDPSAIGEQIRKIEDLEKRVQVLERIVTSGKYDLKREIDELARN